MGLRDAIKALSPTWLQDGTAEKYLYNFGLAADAILEKLNQGMKLHMPGYGDPSALPLVGNDRLIPQGQNESNASSAGRLKGALDAWRLAGTATSILRQILGSVSPATPTVRTVTNSSIWDTIIAGASSALPPSHFQSGLNWFWDFLPYWWRAWVIVYSIGGSPWPTPTATYAGGAHYGDGTCWNWAGGVGAAQTLTAILKLWKPAHAWVPFILVAYDATLFDPAQPFGSSKLPDGHYTNWSKVVTISGRPVYVPSRMGNVSYLAGST
jgi:hypothetical protein